MKYGTHLDAAPQHHLAATSGHVGLAKNHLPACRMRQQAGACALTLYGNPQRPPTGACCMPLHRHTIHTSQTTSPALNSCAARMFAALRGAHGRQWAQGNNSRATRMRMRRTAVSRPDPSQGLRLGGRGSPSLVSATACLATVTRSAPCGPQRPCRLGSGQKGAHLAGSAPRQQSRGLLRPSRPEAA